MEIRLLEAELFHADWTNMTKLRAIFPNFENAPKN